MEYSNTAEVWCLYRYLYIYWQMTFNAGKSMHEDFWARRNWCLRINLLILSRWYKSWSGYKRDIVVTSRFLPELPNYCVKQSSKWNEEPSIKNRYVSVHWNSGTLPCFCCADDCVKALFPLKCQEWGSRSGAAYLGSHCCAHASILVLPDMWLALASCCALLWCWQYFASLLSGLLASPFLDCLIIIPQIYYLGIKTVPLHTYVNSRLPHC